MERERGKEIVTVCLSVDLLGYISVAKPKRRGNDLLIIPISRDLHSSE